MITITNKNIYHSDSSISTLSSLENVDILESEDIIKFLSEDVELGENLKFKRLFDIVSENVEMFNEIFYSSLGGYALGPFLQEIENNPTEIINSDFIEVSWSCDQYEEGLSIYPSLNGVSSKDNLSYSLDFVSLNNIKYLIVKLNKKVELFNYNKKKKEINTQNLGDKEFTLFELYHCIFNEISFNGGPQDKKERWSELEESLSEAEKELFEEDNENENEYITSFDDLLEKFDLQDKYLVKYKDLRDRVDVERMINKKNLDNLKGCLLEKLKVYDDIQNSEDLTPFYKKLTDIEYNMQLLYGEDEDITFHRFWETPKCTCPKIDNLEIYPSKKPVFDKNCPIHERLLH